MIARSAPDSFLVPAAAAHWKIANIFVHKKEGLSCKAAACITTLSLTLTLAGVFLQFA